MSSPQEPLEVFDALAAAIAFLSMLVSGFFASRSMQAEKHNQRLNEDSHRLGLSSWKLQYISEIRQWASEVCDTMAGAVQLCDSDPKLTENPSYYERQRAIIAALSSQLDRGRWFFPNDVDSGYGQHKREVNWGFRPPVLDQVCFAHDLTRDLRYDSISDNKSKKKMIIDIQKNFVNEVYKIIGPHEFNEELNSISRILSTTNGNET